MQILRGHAIGNWSLIDIDYNGDLKSLTYDSMKLMNGLFLPKYLQNGDVTYNYEDLEDACNSLTSFYIRGPTFIGKIDIHKGYKTTISDDFGIVFKLWIDKKWDQSQIKQLTVSIRSDEWFKPDTDISSIDRFNNCLCKLVKRFKPNTIELDSDVSNKIVKNYYAPLLLTNGFDIEKLKYYQNIYNFWDLK